jgi:uncharacterized protein YoxC
MSASQWAGLIAAGAFVVLIIFIIPILLQLRRTLATLNQFVERAEREILPTLNKLQTTVEEVNQELAKVGDTTSSVQDAAKKIDNIVRLVQEIVSSPLVRVASISAGVQVAARSLLRRQKCKK